MIAVTLGLVGEQRRSCNRQELTEIAKEGDFDSPERILGDLDVLQTPIDPCKLLGTDHRAPINNDLVNVSKLGLE